MPLPSGIILEPDPVRLRALVAEAELEPRAILHLPVDGIESDEALLVRIKECLSFPEYCGLNWDAIEECLAEYVTIGQDVLLLVGPLSGLTQVQPMNKALLWDVLLDAAAESEASGNRFTVVLSTHGLA